MLVKRFTQSLGALAAATLVLAGLSAAAASAATQPAATQLAAAQPGAGAKAQWQADIGHVREPDAGCYRASYPAVQWHAARCVTAPRIPVIPRPMARPARHAGPAAVGNGADYSAQVAGLISQATGTFQDVSPGVTEQGYLNGQGSLTANAFSLQLNSQFFTGSPACSGSGNPANCQAWQQFVYTYESPTSSYLFMQYWLISYDATCPTGWITYSTDCYTNSNAVQVPTLTASQLATVQMTGSAVSGGNDAVALSTGGQATSVTNADNEIDLAGHWNTTEWGVYGDGSGSAADFGANTTLQAQTALTATSSAAPSCLAEGFTGETNNLSLTSTPALGTQSTPTMASRQTDGTTGTASCAVAAGSTSPPPPPAPSYEAAFQASNGSLTSVGASNNGSWGLGMAPATSPGAALLTNGQYEYAFQANTGSLWTVGSDNHGTWNQAMAAGTSPSITALTGGGYEVAFQASNGSLWTVGTAGSTNWGLGMAAHTSPSITGLANGSYEVGFQANTGALWALNSRTGAGSLGFGMAGGTSPSITALSNGSYEIAFQANTGTLWTVGSDNHGTWNQAMASGTSPSITSLTNGSYQVAFQASTGLLWTLNRSGAGGSQGYGMAGGTSPSITGLTNGSYEIAFQANTGTLWTVGSINKGPWNLAMAAGTSPSITG
jgi:hypothetical protein